MIDRVIWRNGNTIEGHQHNVAEMRKYLTNLGFKFCEYDYSDRYIFSELERIDIQEYKFHYSTKQTKNLKKGGFRNDRKK